MLTSNTEFELFEIRVSPLVRCREAYIVDTSFVTELINIAWLGYSKRFVVFVCCEDQKIHAEKSSDEIMRICKEMMNDKLQTFHVDITEEDEILEKRKYH